MSKAIKIMSVHDQKFTKLERLNLLRAMEEEGYDCTRDEINADGEFEFTFILVKEVQPCQ